MEESNNFSVMDIDTHLQRLEGRVKDTTFWKNKLLAGDADSLELAPNFLNQNLVNYDCLKCIESKYQNGLTLDEEMKLSQELPNDSPECVLIYLNILLNRKLLPIKSDELLTKIMQFENSLAPISRRISLLKGASNINDLFDEDGLIVIHLLQSENLEKDFDRFAEFTNYQEDIILDFILYDCEKARFLQVLLKLFKRKVFIEQHYPELKQLLDRLVITLKKCKSNLIYNPQVLINYWENNTS